MKIEIDGYLLESDNHEFVVSEIKILGERSKYCGEKHYINRRFYGTLAGAINGLLNATIKNSTATTLKELITEVRLYREFIEKELGR